MNTHRLQLLRWALLVGTAVWLVPVGAQPPPQEPDQGAPSTQAAGLRDRAGGGAHLSLFAPYAAAPGRPDWAPLEMLWGRREWREPLVQRLQQDDPVERGRAALALGLIGAQRAREPLAAALRDQDAAVRREAALALCYLGDQRGEAGAVRVLGEGEVWQRYLALVGLWRLYSPDTRAVLDALQPEQGSFLRALLPQALRSAPWRPLPPYPSRAEETPAAAPGDGLWEQIADELVLTSDYWWHRGDYDQCCVLLEASLFFSPHRMETYDDVAWLQWSLGRGRRAVQVLEQGIAANPDSWQAHFNLGFHYFNTKRYAQALPYLKYAAEHTETWWVPLHTYAHDLEALGKREEARQVWEEAVRRFPQDVTARRNLDRVKATK
jgi:tetratricopeptide (TPR) repeat protein